MENKIELIKKYLTEIKTPFQQKNELPTYEEGKVWIYMLSDPTNISLTCYVGKAIDARDRYRRHLWPSELISNGSTERYLHNWVISLLRRGVEPVMVILEQVAEAEFAEAECFYIAYYRSIGMDLCNLTDGGEGASGYKHTDEGIEKMRQAKLGIPMPKSVKVKLINKVVIDDINKIIELYNSQYSLNEIGELYDVDNESIKHGLQWADIKIREEKHTERSKDKLREANIGKIQTSEHIKKRMIAMEEYKHSDETRNKISTTRIEKLATGEITMPTNRATGKDAGRYRADVDDDLLLKLYNDGLSLREIGRQTDMEHHSVKDRLIKVGIKFEVSSKKDTTKFVFDLPNALQLYHSGLSCNAIGKEIGCDSKVVKKHLERAGIVFEKAINSRKNLDGHIERIKELYGRQFTYAEIGRMFDTTGATIKAYLTKIGIVE